MNLFSANAEAVPIVHVDFRRKACYDKSKEKRCGEVFLFIFLRKRPYRPVEGCWRLPYSGTLRIFSFSKFRKEVQRNEGGRNSGDEGCKQEDREAV